MIEKVLKTDENSKKLDLNDRIISKSPDTKANIDSNSKSIDRNDEETFVCDWKDLLATFNRKTSLTLHKNKHLGRFRWDYNDCCYRAPSNHEFKRHKN